MQRTNVFATTDNKKKVIGLIHLLPLPGTPFYQPPYYEKSLQKAVADAKALDLGGADGCLVQSVDHIYPNTDESDYMRIACMAVILNEIKKHVREDFLVGVQILWNCISPSLAVAKSVGADFIRCTSFVDEVQSPYGLISPNPLRLMEYRKKIEAEDVCITTEIAGYHFPGKYDEAELSRKAVNALKMRLDAVEIFDSDEETNNKMADYVRTKFPQLPVVLGGGTTVQNVKTRLKHANAVFAGSCFQPNGWGTHIDQQSVGLFMKEVKELEIEGQ